MLVWICIINRRRCRRRCSTADNLCRRRRRRAAQRRRPAATRAVDRPRRPPVPLSTFRLQPSLPPPFPAAAAVDESTARRCAVSVGESNWCLVDVCSALSAAAAGGNSISSAQCWCSATSNIADVNGVGQTAQLAAKTIQVCFARYGHYKIKLRWQAQFYFYAAYISRCKSKKNDKFGLHLRKLSQN